jgi:hypothetical protein
VKKFLLPLVLLAGTVNAASIPAAKDSYPREGSLSTEAAVLYGVSGATWVPVAVSATGALVTNGAATALVPTGLTGYDATSTTAQSINLTTSAGASVPCMVCLSSNGGAAAGFKVQFTTSATAPVALTSSSQGAYIAASTTAQCWGPFAAGTILHAAGVAATSSILVDVQKVQ